MRIITLLLALSLLMLVTACDQKKTATPIKAGITIITAQTQTQASQLFFSGNVEPIQISNVISPVDGTLDAMHFHFGDAVKTGQLLFTLDSTKAQQDFRDAVTKYLTAKDTYLNSQAKFVGQQMLEKDGLVARNDFESTKSGLATDQLAYEQAQFQLVQIVQKLKGQNNNNAALLDSLTSLSLGDKNVEKVLQLKFDKLNTFATGDGVALFPLKTDTSSDSGSSGQLGIGSSVKEGQVLVSIGNLSGLSVKISVNEVDIDKIKLGMPAVITGVAFPNINLAGKVSAVALQADTSNSSGDGLPSFPVTITIPILTPEQAQIIHVGMSAQVQINLSNPPQIYLPINAVQNQNGQNFVTIVDPKTGAYKQAKVTTGATTLDSVVITHGVQVGDQVVVNN